MMGLVISYMLDKQINYDKKKKKKKAKKKRKSLTGPLAAFTLKACSIKRRIFRYLVN